MPHVTRIDRKPKGVGCEIKNCADADTKVMLQLEIQEGAEIMCTSLSAAVLSSVNIFNYIPRNVII